MKVLFDTSALIPALTLSVPNHAEALDWLERAQRNEISGFISAHALAELCAGLTGHGKQRPEDVQALIDAEIVPYLSRRLSGRLTESEYLQVIEEALKRRFSGAILFDYIHAYAARKVSSDIILMGNQKDFNRICPNAPPAIVLLPTIPTTP